MTDRPTGIPDLNHRSGNHSSRHEAAAVDGRAQNGQSGLVERDSPKRDWVSDLPSGEPLKDGLARLVDADDDEAERQYYEAAADPEFVALEREQRRYRGAFTARMRRMGAKRRQP